MIKIYKFSGSERYKKSNYIEFTDEELGLHLDDDTLGVLRQPSAMKDCVTNVVARENGTRYETNRHIAERSITLNFVMIGLDYNDLDIKLDSLENILYQGDFALEISELPNQVFFLNYVSFATFALSRSRKVVKIAIKANEFNPSKRNWG